MITSTLFAAHDDIPLSYVWSVYDTGRFDIGRSSPYTADANKRASVDNTEAAAMGELRSAIGLNGSPAPFACLVPSFATGLFSLAATQGFREPESDHRCGEPMI